MDNILDKTCPSMLHLLTSSEADVLDAASFIKFGELLDVEIEHSDPKVSRRVTAAQVAFIQIVRDEGVSRLNTIIVHNGQPSQIEIEGRHGTIKYRRKVRFN